LKRLRVLALRHQKDSRVFPDIALDFRKAIHEMTDACILAALYSQPGLSHI